MLALLVGLLLCVPRSARAYVGPGAGFGFAVKRVLGVEI